MNTRTIYTALLVLGLLVSSGQLAQGAKEDKGEKKKEKTKMTLADCPEAVRKTFEEETKGATIGEVKKAVEDGAATYETDVEIKGKPYQIRVAEDGTLIQKKLRDKPKDGKKETL